MPQPIWTLRRGEESLPFAGNWNPIPRSSSPHHKNGFKVIACVKQVLHLMLSTVQHITRIFFIFCKEDVEKTDKKTNRKECRQYESLTK
jgi:hypothetical protein